MTNSVKQQAVSSKQGTSQTITKFTDLRAWQEGHLLVISIYKLTQDFPAQEQFGLTSQIRRSAVSITSNIAEGFSRPTTKDKLRFYSMALGSLTELQNQMLIARDVGYVSSKDLQIFAKNSVVVHKIINGLKKSLNSGKGVKK